MTIKPIERVPDVRWFALLGNCQCGKPGIGVLKGSQNESFGAACRVCANKMLRKASDQRDAAHSRLAGLQPGGEG